MAYKHAALATRTKLAKQRSKTDGTIAALDFSQGFRIGQTVTIRGEVGRVSGFNSRTKEVGVTFRGCTAPSYYKPEYLNG